MKRFSLRQIHTPDGESFGEMRADPIGNYVLYDDHQEELRLLSDHLDRMEPLYVQESCGPSGHPPPVNEAGTEGNGGTPTRGTRETSREQHDRIRANMLAAEAWCEGTTPNEKRLRFLLAARVGITYGDDGELQSSYPFPPIDFKRDTVEEIEEAIQERGLAKLAESLADKRVPR